MTTKKKKGDGGSDDVTGGQDPSWKPVDGNRERQGGITAQHKPPNSTGFCQTQVTTGLEAALEGSEPTNPLQTRGHGTRETPLICAVWG